MRPTLAAAAAAGLACLTRAEAQAFVSPAEFAATEGPGSSTLPLSATRLRYQQVDTSTSTAAPQILSWMEFRRDGCLAAVAPGRTLSLELLLSDGSCAAFTATFAANLSAAATVVVAASPVSFAAWAPSTQCPPPFDNRIPFATPFLLPPGTDLLWDMRILGGSSTAPYPADEARNIPCWSGCSSELAPGCLVPMRSAPMSHSLIIDNCGSGTTVTSNLVDGPGGGLAWLLLCPCPCMPVAGLCAPAYVTAPSCVLVSSTTTSPSGGASWSARFGLAGNQCQRICSQWLALDSGMPLSFFLSNARCTRLAADPVTTACIKRAWANDPSAAVATAVAAAGIVVRFGT